jgi:hypothetical protein
MDVRFADIAAHKQFFGYDSESINFTQVGTARQLLLEPKEQGESGEDNRRVRRFYQADCEEFDRRVMKNLGRVYSVEGADAVI